MNAAAECETHYHSLAGTRQMLGKLESVIREKWPEALSGNPFEWARSQQPELMRQHDSLEKEANELWLNGRATEFKAIATQWGRKVLEIMKLYAAHLRQGGM